MPLGVAHVVLEISPPPGACTHHCSATSNVLFHLGPATAADQKSYFGVIGAVSHSLLQAVHVAVTRGAPW